MKFVVIIIAVLGFNICNDLSNLIGIENMKDTLLFIFIILNNWEIFNIKKDTEDIKRKIDI